jgi:hypothetical protein
MRELRFNKHSADGYTRACEAFARAFAGLAEEFPDTRLIFIPHIFKDLEIISDVMSVLPDRLRRTRVYCAPYLSGFGGTAEILGIYKLCKVSIGMPIPCKRLSDRDGGARNRP